FHAGDGKGILRMCAGGNCWGGERRLNRGIWYHVAVTFKSGIKDGVKLFVNGKLDREHTTAEKTKENRYMLMFGRASTGGGAWRPVHKGGTFDGIIDDISIWNRTLTKEEIKRGMWRRWKGTERDRKMGLLGYWDFNEGSGDLVHDQ